MSSARRCAWGRAISPRSSAILLVILGLATTVRAFVIDGPPVQGLALKAILLVLGPIVLFGFILRGAGLARRPAHPGDGQRLCQQPVPLAGWRSPCRSG